jgi:hypothetical protein
MPALRCRRAESKTYVARFPQILLDRIDNPFLQSIVATGGEPTLNPHFMEMINLITTYFGARGRPIGTINRNCGRQELRQQLWDKLTEELPEDKLEHLKSRRELGHYLLQKVNAELPPEIGLELYTNGWNLLGDEDQFIKGIIRLADLGINYFTISADQPHRQYTDSIGLEQDYALIKEISTIPSNERARRVLEILPAGIHFAPTGVGDYVIPIGKAKEWPWSRLLRYHSSDNTPRSKTQVEEMRQEIREQLGYEYDGWWNIGNNHTTFSHNCYCSIQKMFHDHEKTEKCSPENRYLLLEMTVDPLLGFHKCSFQIPPSPGNLRDSTIEEIYQNMISDEVYQTLGHEGPQGLLRKFTSIPEEEIRERFIERTPCGLCEDYFRGAL